MSKLNSSSVRIAYVLCGMLVSTLFITSCGQSDKDKFYECEELGLEAFSPELAAEPEGLSPGWEKIYNESKDKFTYLNCEKWFPLEARVFKANPYVENPE